MFKKILVPLDGSQLAEKVLPEVEKLAKVHDAEVTLLRIALIHAFPGTDKTDMEVRVVEEAEVYLAGIEKRLKSAGLKVSSMVRYGHAAVEIIDHAKVHHCDLIAMSTHGRSGFGQFVLGSIAIKVLHAATVPVLLFRAES